MTTSITLRSVKKSNLTWAELDTTLSNLKTNLDSTMAAQSAGMKGYTTVALMNADLTPPANTLALVTNDDTESNNVQWIKIGASGTGSWQKSSLYPMAPLNSPTFTGTVTINSLSTSNTTQIVNLNADMVDGLHMTQSGAANSVVATNDSGNLGIGGSPGAWGSGFKSLDIGSHTSLSYYNSSTYLTSNVYYDGSAWKHRTSNTGGAYIMQNGAHIWHCVATGTAESAATLTQAMALDSSGNLLVGVTSGINHTISKSTTSTVLTISGANAATSAVAYFNNCDTAGSNLGQNAGLYVQKNGANGRSVNCAGTVNTSGADYAEYETKADSCGTVAKGQIIGLDADGNVTDKWVDSFSFGIKTTNPSYVGGDVWASEDIVGKRPEQPAEDAEQSITEQYIADLAAYEARVETERQKFDRIAYAGKCPCNIQCAAVGDYIIATQDGDGIKGIAVSSPTFDQYRLAVGRVRRILEDGRVEIAIIVH